MIDDRNQWLTSSSKSWSTKEDMVVTTPMNRLAQARPTKAELGTSKIKLAGYIIGIDDNLHNQKSVFNKSIIVYRAGLSFNQILY